MGLSFIIEDLVHLFYPRVCLTCGTALVKNEEVLCTGCLYDIPRTNFHKERENPVSQLFWGRIPVEYATAFFYFNKGSKYQKLLHELKYKGYQQIGLVMGQHMGYALNTSVFSFADCIVPVPLHRAKQKKRGYNQSELIARGMATIMGKPMISENLYRAVNTDTQTRRSRYERWENVSDIFSVLDPEKLKNKHIIIVDDVVTTGSTLEASVHALHRCEGVKVSVVAMAVA